MIYVIEPHADDAFLSLGGHIEMWIKEGKQVTIVTVYSGTRKRAKDAKAYADAVGARWLGLEGVEGRVDTLSLENSIRMWISGQDYYRQYVLPVAVTHPEHMWVRDTFEKYLPEIKATVYFYVDQPYASITKNGEAVLNAVTRPGCGRLQSWLKPNARKYRHIPLFKDQAKFFHFNPAEKLKHNVEVIFQ